MDKVSVCWFRRDLRLDDNAAFYHALKGKYPVVPVFIFDTEILNDLKDKKDKRVAFIHDALLQMQQELEQHGSTPHVLHGTPKDCFEKLKEEYDLQAVYTNNDYEPYARQRDEQIATMLKKEGIGFHAYKDQVIFEKDEVMKGNREPYNVFTPYSKKWKEKLNDFYLRPYPTKNYFSNLYKRSPRRIPSLEAIGFKDAYYDVVNPEVDKDIVKDYDKTRDTPAIHGTTHMGVHLRFGTVSIRQLAAEAQKLNGTYLNELIWREFYQMILWHYPHVVNHTFREEYDRIQWRNNDKEFELWREGKTGVPIVDAGMRELNETGFMHNRVRMIAASFLCKHLLIDWRWGEAYFAKKLLDYDLASNNGNWQWAAGTGVDAAPYFRIFNPYTQREKFDPDYVYVKKWVPEYGSQDYPEPIVNHKEARERCLQVYKAALNKR